MYTCNIKLTLMKINKIIYYTNIRSINVNNLKILSTKITKVIIILNYKINLVGNCKYYITSMYVK